MKRILTIVMLLMFGIAQPALAGVVTLSDVEMDEIDAGEWVVIDPSTQAVVDVHYSANDIELSNESQTELKAVNNANAVDSAIAVQTNIARSSAGDPVEAIANLEVNQSNHAEILNYNPSESESAYSNVTSSSSETSQNSTSSSSVSGSAASFSSSESSSCEAVLDYDETLDINIAKSAAGEEEGKGYENEFAEACAVVVDYDKTIDFTLKKTSQAAGSKECVSTSGTTATSSGSASTVTTTTTNTGSESRKNLSENNHLDLEDVSQNSLMAVSNLHAVGSGAAVQTNIASNVGVGGTFNQSNTASVINGL